ncbi:hypothetical protein [Fulvivirga sediminis]|uniref:Uncharacterized protein n=1 Tax=Fulvivirga sediminis TaxID=2803949 RepID=A0A937FB28_9BACT|nr:hypothetical protein [Fulvivirga sediminis]MBL3657213.1 hypothetical protein [Fulvivirga sediminis]
MGKIKIVSNYAAKVYIDEKNVGIIKKETKEYELEPGQHIIYARTAWCRSEKLTINITSDEICEFTLASFKYENVAKAVIMMLAALFMLTKSFIFLVIAGFCFLYPLYFVSIGYNQYLQLKRS